MKFKIWLYKHIRAWFAKLEKEVIQQYNYEKAAIARKKFRNNMTQGTYDYLIKRRNQDVCDHLKGHGKASSAPRGPMKDYAVLTHTFTDGHTEVKCMICGKKFDLKDEKTKMMIQSSTNYRSSSEVIPVIIRDTSKGKI